VGTDRIPLPVRLLGPSDSPDGVLAVALPDDLDFDEFVAVVRCLNSKFDDRFGRRIRRRVTPSTEQAIQ